jgi:hypothetical protein
MVALGTLASKRRPGTKADRKTRRRGVLEHDRDLLKKRREMAIMDEGRRQLAGRMSRQKNLAAGEVAEHRRCKHVQDVGEQAVARGRAWQQKDERRRYVAEDLDENGRGGRDEVHEEDGVRASALRGGTQSRDGDRWMTRTCARGTKGRWILCVG